MTSITLPLYCLITAMTTALPPETQKTTVIDTYHGVAVPDDYRSRFLDLADQVPSFHASFSSE